MIDFRALWRLGGGSADVLHLRVWWAYTLACGGARSGVTVRALDRALWQYSKERQAQ